MVLEYYHTRVPIPYKKYLYRQQFDLDQKICNPTLNEHAVRKDYVDAGLSTKENTIIKNTAFNLNLETSITNIKMGLYQLAL